MNRQEYLDSIRSKLHGLSEEDIDKALEFYKEALDDRIEDGLSEEQAIKAVGSAEEVANQILMDTPLPKLVSAGVKPQGELKVWHIVLIILSSPIWILIAAVAFSVFLTVMCLIFTLIITVISVVLGLTGGGLFALTASIAGLIAGQGMSAMVKFGLSLVCVGLGSLLFLPCKSIVLWLIELIGRFFKSIKRFFVNKRTVKVS